MIVSIVDKNKIGNEGKSVLGAVFRIPVFPPYLASCTGGREDRDGILGGCEEGFNERKVLPM